MKKAVLRHLKGTTHISASSYENFIKRKLQKIQNLNLTMGRCVYRGILNGDGYTKYPERVMDLQLAGVDVGCKNHGVDFASKFSKVLCDEFKSMLVAELGSSLPATGRPSPISVMADKATPRNRTLQTASAVYLSRTGQVRSIVLSARRVDQATDGRSLAAHMAEDLRVYIPTEDDAKRIVSLAFDGQYFNLNVPYHLSSNLNLDTNKLICSWDPAHIIELALSDMRSFCGTNNNTLWTRR